MVSCGNRKRKESKTRRISRMIATEPTAFSLEARVIEGLTQPLTLGELSDKIGISASPLLKALQFMHQKQQIDCQHHHERAKAYWCRKNSPVLKGAVLVTGTRPT